MMLLTTTRLLIYTNLLMMVACSAPDSPENKQHSAQDQPTSISPKSQDKTVKIRPESHAFLKIVSVSDQQTSKPISSPGRVEFRQKAQALVGSQVAGRVADIKTQVGDEVKAGQPLLVINSFEAAKVRAELSTAKAELLLAEQTATRQVQMLSHGVGLELEKMAADRQLATAKAEWERTEQTAQLLGNGDSDQVIIKAPIAGTVVKINATIGESVEPNQEPLLEIGNTHDLWVIAEVFESDLKFIQKGDLATIEVATLQGATLQGNVVALGTAFSDEQRRVPVYIGLEQPHHNLRPGMYARITLYPRAENHLMLPSTAVLIKGKRTVVYIEIENDVYQEREIHVGLSNNGMISVLEGLSPNERVVIDGALLLDGEAEQLL